MAHGGDVLPDVVGRGPTLVHSTKVDRRPAPWPSRDGESPRGGDEHERPRALIFATPLDGQHLAARPLWFANATLPIYLCVSTLDDGSRAVFYPVWDTFLSGRDTCITVYYQCITIKTGTSLVSHYITMYQHVIHVSQCISNVLAHYRVS